MDEVRRVGRLAFSVRRSVFTVHRLAFVSAECFTPDSPAPLASLPGFGL
jgi:hypothetical protein